MCTHIIRKRTFDALSSFFFPFLLFSLNLLQISLKVKQFSITGCQAYATVTSHFSWYQKQPSTRAHSWNTAGSSTSPNSTEQVKKILTPFLPSLCCCFPCCSGEGIDPTERRVCVGAVLGAWEEDVVAIPWAGVCKPCRGKLVWMFLS